MIVPWWRCCGGRIGGAVALRAPRRATAAVRAQGAPVTLQSRPASWRWSSEGAAAWLAVSGSISPFTRRPSRQRSPRRTPDHRARRRRREADSCSSAWIPPTSTHRARAPGTAASAKAQYAMAEKTTAMNKQRSSRASSRRRGGQRRVFVRGAKATCRPPKRNEGCAERAA